MKIIRKAEDIKKENTGNDHKKIMLYNKKWQNMKKMLKMYGREVLQSYIYYHFVVVFVVNL